MNDTDILIEKIERLTERCDAFQECNDHLWSRIGKLETALRGIAENYSWVEQIQRTVRTALAPEQDK